MRIIGVLDLKGGVVVRGVGGRREEYRPIVSALCPSPGPLDVARAMRSAFGLEELYLADLDAIGVAEPAWEVYRGLRLAGFRIWVDAGLRQAQQGQRLAAAGVQSVVAGLETVAGPEVLEQLVDRLGRRVVFSLDLRAGEALGAWGQREPWDIALNALRRGVRRLLVLDLARVGQGQGTGTEELCARLAAAYPDVEIAAGGGVRGRADLVRLRAAGVSAVLVASALHDGRLVRADLEGL